MAVAISEPTTSVVTTTDGTSLALGSYTPSADSIQVAICVGKGTLTDAATLTDTEGAWTREAVGQFWDATFLSRMWVFWRKVDASPVAINPTLDTGADGFTAAGIMIFEIIPDVMPSGNPIRQYKFNANNSGTTSVSPTITFNSAPLTGNGLVASAVHATNAADFVEPPTDWTETRELAVSSPGTGPAGAYRAGGQTTTGVTFTLDSADLWSIFAVEVWNEEPPTNAARARLGRGVGRGLSLGMR